MRRFPNHIALSIVGAGLLLAMVAVLLAACVNVEEDSAADERVVELEATVASLERTAEELAAENAGLKEDIGALDRERAELAEALEATLAALVRERAELMEALATADSARQREIELLDARIEALEEIVTRVGPLLSLLDPSSKDAGGLKPQPDGDVVERTARLAESFGGEVYYVKHDGRGDRTVLVMPLDIVAGETPLIVSLHGFGGDSALHSTYLPLHERVNVDGFGLLLPNGAPGPDGNRFWNPTDAYGGKSGLDDVAYLTELIGDAREVKDFGPVYVIGYSNGGFMAHHMGCKGLPGLRGVASLAGTSYVDDASCAGAAPVSVLHVHGTADDVLRFDGDVSVRVETGNGEAAHYLGARDIVRRWSGIAGCAWPVDAEPYATLDFDQNVPGAETRAYRQASGCAEGVTIELWESEGTGHLPGYGVGFVDALVRWLVGRG